MPNTYACELVSNPNVPIFLPRVCTLVLFIQAVIEQPPVSACMSLLTLGTHAQRGLQ